MTAEPVAIPVTIPVAEPTVAMLLLLLLQVPPVVIDVNVPVDPTQILDGPEITAGKVLTVTAEMRLHPVGKV